MTKKPFICECGGKMEIKIVTRQIPIGGQIITLQNVEAKVCPKCGEIYYNGKMLLEIENKIENESLQTI
jgi:YgiT-type zinc finger domain-containing protein